MFEKKDLTHLANQLPSRMAVPSIVTDRLNSKGIRTIKGNRFTSDIVKNMIYGRTADSNKSVETELTLLIAEQKGRLDLAKGLEQIQEQLTQAV